MLRYKVALQALICLILQIRNGFAAITFTHFTGKVVPSLLEPFDESVSLTHLYSSKVKLCF